MAVPVPQDAQPLVREAAGKHAAMMSKGIMPEFDALKAKDFDAYRRIQVQYSSTRSLCVDAPASRSGNIHGATLNAWILPSAAT